MIYSVYPLIAALVLLIALLPLIVSLVRQEIGK